MFTFSNSQNDYRSINKKLCLFVDFPCIYSYQSVYSAPFTPQEIVQSGGGRRLSMLLQPGERWHCTNPACRCTVVIESGTWQEGVNPRCSCGSVMKKDFRPPVLFCLNFLKFVPPFVATETSDQD